MVSAMSSPELDQRRLARVMKIARLDAWSLLALAAPAGGFALVSRDAPASLTAVGVVLCGLCELHGHACLRRRQTAGMRWLIAAQLSCLFFLIVYAGFVARAATAEHLLSLLPSFTKEQLVFIFPDPAELQWWLVRLQQLSALLLAGGAIAYQGGMTWFYARSRAAICCNFSAPPVLVDDSRSR